jgi:hypothetical protein
MLWHTMARSVLAPERDRSAPRGRCGFGPTRHERRKTLMIGSQCKECSETHGNTVRIHLECHLGYQSGFLSPEDQAFYMKAIEGHSSSIH